MADRGNTSPRTGLLRVGVLLLGMLVGGLAGSAQAQLTAQQKADIGFTSLQERLGGSMPLGSGVSVTIVEAPLETGEYRVNTSDGQLTGKTYQFPSGGNTGASWHATTVGRYLFGTQSLAPRIGATTDGSTVANYEANNWIEAGFLRPAANQLPLVETRKLVSHSWVSFGTSTAILDRLQRADYAVRRDGTIATYALGNGSDTTIPSLMASTYNGMVVGLSSGNHSRGTTTINGSGRQKPDLVVPTEFTSWATPTVSSAAGLLVQVAGTGGLGNGQRQQVVKSLLMAGATKAGPNLPGTWSWSNSSTQPLDSIYGAGQLNIEAAYDILVADEFNASNSSLAAVRGWDFGLASNSTPQRYFFDIDPSLAGGSLTASLNWQIDVTATLTGQGINQSYSFSNNLANLDLRLYSASGFSLGGLLAESISSNNNTELIWSQGLAPGRYALQVTSNTNNVDYGLAWTVAVPEPGTWMLLAVAVAGGFAVRAQRWSRAA